MIYGLLLVAFFQSPTVDIDLVMPLGVWLDDSGLWVADAGAHRVVCLDPASGAVKVAFGREGEGPGELIQPELVWVDGPDVWVSCSANRRLHRFTKDGTFVESLPVSGAGYLAGRLGDRWVMVGSLPGEFGGDGSVVRLVDSDWQVEAEFLRPSALSRKARGLSQSHLVVLDQDAGEIFYGDPLDFEQIYRINPGSGRVSRIPVMTGDLLMWDGRGQLRQRFGEFDQFHIAGHLNFRHEGRRYLTVTWLRPALEPTFQVQVFDIDAGTPIAAFDAPAFPAGVRNGDVIFFNWDGETLFLPRVPIHQLLTGTVGFPSHSTDHTFTKESLR